MTTEAFVDQRLQQEALVKCMVWDLDETVWEGTLLSHDSVLLRAEAVAVMEQLDQRGILQSIASRNDHDVAWARLRELGLDHFFVYPQIGWSPKSRSVAEIARLLNIGIDSLAFIDDQQFELDEVATAHPDVLCLPTSSLSEVVTAPAFRPRFVTDESKTRRQMYQGAVARDQAQEEFAGTPEQFLAGLDLAMSICPATLEDLRRAEELTVRTNQLNSTGRTYDFEDLHSLTESPDHLVLVAALDDRYGSYGKIGLALVDTSGTDWVLQLLIMSCRVVSRGVGTILLNDVMRRAVAADAGLVAEFVDTGRNRMMAVTYAFAGFLPDSEEDGVQRLRCSLQTIQAPPAYVRMDVR